MVLSRIKDLPRPTRSANDIVYNCPSDLILPEVEDTDGIVQSFTIDNSHDSLTSGNEKASLLWNFSGSCCGQFGHDSSDCPIMGGNNLNGDALGYL